MTKVTVSQSYRKIKRQLTPVVSLVFDSYRVPILRVSVAPTYLVHIISCINFSYLLCEQAAVSLKCYVYYWQFKLRSSLLFW